MFNFVLSSLPLVRQGQLRALAVLTANRLSVTPDLPTMGEAGVAGVEVSSWSAFFVPAKTPREIIRKIHTNTVAALPEAAIKEKLEHRAFLKYARQPMPKGWLSEQLKRQARESAPARRH